MQIGSWEGLEILSQNMRIYDNNSQWLQTTPKNFHNPKYSWREQGLLAPRIGNFWDWGKSGGLRWSVTSTGVPPASTVHRGFDPLRRVHRDHNAAQHHLWTLFPFYGTLKNILKLPMTLQFAELFLNMFVRHCRNNFCMRWAELHWASTMMLIIINMETRWY